MPYKPIPCHFHDTIEIACMWRYKLDIKLLSGESIQGIAETTRSFEKEEFLILLKNQQHLEIRLDEIKSISKITK